MCVLVEDERVCVCKEAQRVLGRPRLNVMRALPRRAGHGEGRRQLEMLCRACQLLGQSHGDRGAAGGVRVERRSEGKDDTAA